MYEERLGHPYVPEWRRFEAKPLALADKADTNIHAARKYPVLQDVTSLRSWWLPGAASGGVVHCEMVPALQRLMPLDCVWRALRFAGYVRDSVGSLVGIANTREELVALRHQIGRGEELRFTSVGHHDDQLTTEEFFAWLRVERASRLECMAAARGRPRPSVPHPEAQPDDCDG